MITLERIIISIAYLCSFLTALADSSANAVLAWGSNIAGEATGVPSYPWSNGVVVTTSSSFATGVVMIAGHVLSNVSSISAGSYHNLAINRDSTVVGWGGNYWGESVGYKTPRPFRTNGEVRLDGHILSNIVAIAAGEHHSLALKNDGTVVAWGDNRSDRSTPPLGLSNVTAIAAGGTGSLALKSDGTVISWGQADLPVGVSNVVAISATPSFFGHDLALRKDGTVLEWGVRGIDEELIVQRDVSNVVAISAGANHSLALKKDGTVFAWDNAHGQTTGDSMHNASGLVVIDGTILSNITAIAAGNGVSLALKKDGTVVQWGRMGSQSASLPAGLSNVVAIAVGNEYGLAITTNLAIAERFLMSVSPFK